MQVPQEVPIRVWVGAILKAQEKALARVDHFSPGNARVSLFWTILNFEFRKEIERWLRNNA